MDPLIAGTLSGVIANALTGLAGQLWKLSPDSLPPKAKAKDLKSDDAILSYIQTDIGTIGGLDTLQLSEAEAGSLKLFLSSAEVESIVRQLYAARLTGKLTAHAPALREVFLSWFAIRVPELENRAEIGNRLFDILPSAIERSIDCAIQNGILAAHDAASISRHRVVTDELIIIKRKLDLLATTSAVSVSDILRFDQVYRHQVADRHRYIIPPHFDAARKLPIEELYVASTVIRIPRKKGEQAVSLNLADFLGIAYRCVLLGNPGAGKSTLALKLSHDLARHYEAREFAGRQLTPILVTLRDYGVAKKDQKLSILQFIEKTASSIYQVDPPPGAFHYLLLNGRACLIFDGLDELLDTHHRQQISADVESLSNLYPSVPVLVTSREIGYEQAPLDVTRFDAFRLSDFNEVQVEQYVNKWFAVDTDLTREQQLSISKSFLEESQIVADLRSNPLMLALMCNIYRGENYIPRNRPDVYEKCAVMLFERWDKGRGILVPLPIEAHVSPAMKFLAHWIYSDERLQGGVTKDALVEKAADYLCSWRFDDPAEARHAAEQFIDFCRGRAWVFTDTGSKGEGDPLYQFTHRTFLEYFTAAHLVRTNSTAGKLGAVILPRIAKREWDVVAQLAFQLLHKQVQGAGDALLMSLVRKSEKGRYRERWNILSFAARSLEFLIPKPKVTREVASACIAFSLDLTRRKPRRETFIIGESQDEPMAIVGALLGAADENRVAIGASLERIVTTQLLRSENNEQASLGAEVVLQLPSFRTHLGRRAPRPGIVEYARSLSDRIYKEHSARIIEICKNSFPICMSAYRCGKLQIGDVVKWHGVEALFRDPSSRLVPNTIWFSIAANLYYSLLSTDRVSRHSGDAEAFVKRLESIGGFLLAAKPPWLKRVHVSIDRWHWRVSASPATSVEQQLPPLKGDALFGAFALLATVVEGSNQKGVTALIQKLRDTSFVPVTHVLSARGHSSEIFKAEAEIAAGQLTSEQEALLRAWMSNDVSFVAPTAKRGR